MQAPTALRHFNACSSTSRGRCNLNGPSWSAAPCPARRSGSSSSSSNSPLRQHKHERLVACHVGPFDAAWGVSTDLDTLVQTLPQNLFALSLFPYLGFLYHLTRSKQTPPLALFGFYFLLVFVGASIPAGIYAKTQYGLPLADVDWLHGGAESLLTMTNLFIVLGMRQAIRQAEAGKNEVETAQAAAAEPGAAEEQPAGARTK